VADQVTAVDQLVCRADASKAGGFHLVATSLDQSRTACWLDRLAPWLRAGLPGGLAYLRFGDWAAVLRWAQQDAVHALAGRADVLTPPRALRLPGWPDAATLRTAASGRLRMAEVGQHPPGGPDGLVAASRSAPAIAVLVPLLSRVLAGDDTVTLPPPEAVAPEAVLCGLVRIVEMMGDRQPLSFLTAGGSQARGPGGLFVQFRQAAGPLITDPGCAVPARGLATGYADDPAGLHRTLTQHRIPALADDAERLAGLTALWPAESGQMEARPVTVTCPVCLHEIRDWAALPRWQWNGAAGAYTKMDIPGDAGDVRLRRLRRGAYVRCPDPLYAHTGEHYLPAGYAEYGPPVIIGLIGVTMSGKSHLLASMAGEIERGGLGDYGIATQPLDQAQHKRFLDTVVYPLMNEHKALPGTQEGVITFADGYVVTPRDGTPRVVTLFDVAGGELTRVDDTREFLDIANGFIFVMDPDQLRDDGLGDAAFSTVLNLVSPAHRDLAAAVVLTKADLIRFDDPVALWLRSDRPGAGRAVVNSDEFSRETADVYAYLYASRALAWARPYSECRKATMHFASPAGGASAMVNGETVFPRGVTPCRVLRPLVAMLAMTGVLTGPEAEKVGI
jgi:hypothetical protein